MISYGVCRRHGRCGLWRRTHDLGGTDWDLILPLAADVALHLHDEGMLSIDGDAASTTLHPGILVTRDAVEARMALRRPESTIARADLKALDLSDERTPTRLSDLWCSARPTN